MTHHSSRCTSQDAPSSGLNECAHWFEQSGRGHPLGSRRLWCPPGRQSRVGLAPAPEMQEKFFLLDSSNNDRYSADLYGSNADTL